VREIGFGLAAASSVALVVAIVLGMRLIPYLPPPAGPFQVGTVLWEINRSGAGYSPSGRGGCPVSVQLWYPAEPGSGEGRALYDSDGAGLLTGARWVRTGARLNAALVTQGARFPVLLSLPGWAGAPGENTAFVQDLASRGFIVAGIGYDDPQCASADGSAGSAAETDFSSPAAFEQTRAVAHQKIERVSEAASHVVDAIETLDRMDPTGRFVGRLDLGRIGVVGYSLGGAIAMQLCWRDERVKAAVNIDGWFFDAAPGGWIKQPLMIISDDSPAPTSANLNDPDPTRRYPAMLDDTSDRRMMSEFAKHGGVMVTVLGSGHLDFSDVAYLSRLALLEGRRPDGATIRTAADYSAAFFGRILNGEQSPLFSNPPPGVRLQAWDRPAPDQSAKRLSPP
jgi:dienelactone hydrolase